MWCLLLWVSSMASFSVLLIWVILLIACIVLSTSSAVSPETINSSVSFLYMYGYCVVFLCYSADCSPFPPEICVLLCFSLLWSLWYICGLLFLLGEVVFAWGFLSVCRSLWVVRLLMHR